MGLFNVNMTLLYGEAERAFIRLQEEIMKISADETLFAWRGKPADYELHGLLALSPAHFENSGAIRQFIHTPRTAPFAATNMGLRLEVLLPKASQLMKSRNFKGQHNGFRKIHVAVLNCIDQNSDNLIGILLGYFDEMGQIVAGDPFVTVDPGEWVLINRDNYRSSAGDRTTIFARTAADLSPITRGMKYY
jgi:hypothetical protein